jgi:SagB-type dehydrogenase family enzyme
VKLVLSRFACVRRQGDELVADGLRERVVLGDASTIALIAALCQPRDLAEAAPEAGMTPDEAMAAAEPLVAAGVLVDADTDAREGNGPWHFDDLRFHAGTRLRLDDLPVPRWPPPPALPPARWEDTVALPLPDLDAIERDDPPLARVQSERHSVREPGPRPLALEQLSEFLFRVGRVEDVWQVGQSLTVTARPYPAAGALYELELYVAVDSCQGVERGLYHYRSDHHELARVSGVTGDMEELLGAAAAGMGAQRWPGALIVIAARFDRIAWKYGPLAYSLVLKNVGVVLQTMYLVATAMGLAPCAVGTGDADAFARATGLDRDEQTSVGEFCLNSAPGP